MLVKLQTGTLETVQNPSGKPALEGGEIPAQLEKKCLLVYPGKFQSMDGEVEVTEEHLTRLIENHNTMLKGLARMAEGAGLPMKACPPIQLDHSTSAKDTVGRLVGDLEMGEHQLADGTKVKALFGNAKILGKENVEKVIDGRWTHLSIGADLEDGKLTELTITPFPAAPGASMLSKTQPAPSEKGNPMHTGFKKHLAEQCKMSDDDINKHTEKMKCHLMEKEKLSAEAAEERMAKMDDEESKKLKGELDEKERLAAEKVESDNKAKMTAAREKLTKLSTELVSGKEKVRLAAKKIKLQARLSALKASAKITPAEIKKIDLNELVTKSDESLEVAFSLYEKREPQVLIGMIGNANATKLSKVKEDKVRLAKLEIDARKNMGREIPESLKRLANGMEEEGSPDTVNVHIDTDPHTDLAMEAADWDEMKRLISEGKEDDAKSVMKRMMDKAMKKMSSTEVTESTETSKEMAAVADEVKQMHSKVEEVVKLASMFAS